MKLTKKNIKEWKTRFNIIWEELNDEPFNTIVLDEEWLHTYEGRSVGEAYRDLCVLEGY